MTNLWLISINLTHSQKEQTRWEMHGGDWTSLPLLEQKRLLVKELFMALVGDFLSLGVPNTVITSKSVRSFKRKFSFVYSRKDISAYVAAKD
mmetsp:Transcript_2915/g.5462  ORF Transcript_2915/g.5462 Transcript_2915/m.5462 type:complete len:92 (-) Transcript_2915:129-404(-)